MSVGIKHAERIRLTGKELNIDFLDAAGKPYTYRMSVDKELGQGTSCICYEVTVYKNPSDCKNPIDSGQKRVLKQFYPYPRLADLDITMDGMKLEIAGYTDDPKTKRQKEITELVNRLGAGFEEAYRMQSEISNKDEIYDIAARPDLCYFDGTTKYVLYDTDYGSTLDLKKIQSIEEFLQIMYSLACALQKLHKLGWIYMDLKPENILISANGDVKLVDLDSVIKMEELENVHLEDGDVRYDTTDLHLIAPEIRPDRLKEFEQNKYVLINNRVDIYSFGAIMLKWFLGRYPSEADCTDDKKFTEEISERFRTGDLRGKLTQEEQTALFHIIWKCIQEDIGEEIGKKGRYIDTRNLVRNLDSLRKRAAVPVTLRRKIYDRVGGRVQAAFVMDQHPLCDYCIRKGENEWVMDALIIGNDPIADDFFSNILACAQMLDTKLVIRIAASGAADQLNMYLNEWPLFAKTCSLYLEDRPVLSKDDGSPVEIDTQITSIPFAEVRFYEWEIQKNPSEFISGMDNRDEISWILVVDQDAKHNYTLANQIANDMHSIDRRLFIGYLDERGDGFGLHKSSVIKRRIDLVPFNANKAWTLEEKHFRKGINQKALLLHKYYMREWNERADKDKIWRDFRSEAYFVNSSFCNVLSIPYKLESLGIVEKKEKAARAYWNMILSPDNPDKQKNIGRLICLEHRRWMSFMLTEGYDFSGNKYKNYAFTGENDHRNKAEKLHICICDCSEDGLVLDRFPHELWDNPNFRDVAAKDKIELDSLDIMSVSFHQFCARKIASMVENGIFEGAFSKLERALSNEKVFIDDSVAEAFSSLRNIHTRMLDNESDINNIWAKTCRLFEETIESVEKNFVTGTKEVKLAYGEVKSLTRIVVERNSYHDYKSSDRTILEVIPLLIMSDYPIRRIHKPAAGQTWQNIASSVIIEPEQLWLYTDDAEELNVEKIRSFLEKERGLFFKENDIQIRPMKELYNLKVTDTSVPAVLDITGLSGEEMYKLAQVDNLRKLPVVFFKDGKIRSMTDGTAVDYYSVLRRHLTVRENFRLHGAYIQSEENQNHMLGLSDNYDKIWEAYIRINAFRYKILCNVLSGIEQKNYWQLDREKQGEEKQFTISPISNRMIRDAGIDKVLLSLRKDRLIENGFVYPKSGEIGRFAVSTKYPDVFEAVQGMLLKALQSPYMHRFLYIKTRREPFTNIISEKDLLYIYDDTRVVDVDLDDEKSIDTNGRMTSAIIEEALEILQEYSRNGEGQIISQYGDRPLVSSSEKTGKYHVCFIYRNRATKECLIKEGNALEAYVYHSLWKSTFVDDIKLNVAFTWEAADAKEALNPVSIQNETDLVCTSRMQTFFISCKQTMPKTEHLQEIKFFADHFGVDGKAILVTSNWETHDPAVNAYAQMITVRAQMMDVYYIDRKMIGQNINMMKENNLAGYLQKIFNRDKNWNE